MLDSVPPQQEHKKELISMYHTSYKTTQYIQCYRYSPTAEPLSFPIYRSSLFILSALSCLFKIFLTTIFSGWCITIMCIKLSSYWWFLNRKDGSILACLCHNFTDIHKHTFFYQYLAISFLFSIFLNSISSK